mgnify:CR=1 FL=1
MATGQFSLQNFRPTGYGYPTGLNQISAGVSSIDFSSINFSFCVLSFLTTFFNFFISLAWFLIKKFLESK